MNVKKVPFFCKERKITLELFVLLQKKQNVPFFFQYIYIYKDTYIDIYRYIYTVSIYRYIDVYI